MVQLRTGHVLPIGPTARTLGPIVLAMAITLLAIVGYLEAVSLIVSSESVASGR